MFFNQLQLLLSSEYAGIDDKLLIILVKSSTNLLSITQSLLIEKAQEFANELSYHGVKVTSDYIKRFKSTLSNLII